MTRSSDDFEDQEAVRLRLRALPRALGYRTQTAFAAALGIAVSRYSNAILTGVIGKDLAITIYRRFPGVRIEWLFFGDHAMMPRALMEKIDAEIEELERTRR
jgi:hypothetical protein